MSLWRPFGLKVQPAISARSHEFHFHGNSNISRDRRGKKEMTIIRLGIHSLFFFFFRKEELPLLHDWRETEEGYAERGDGRLGQQTRGDCCLQRSSSLVRFRLLRRARRKKKKKEKKQKGEINGEDLQQRHNVNTQRYAVLLAQAKETRLLVFTISSLSLFLCSPHFSSSSSSSFKSLRIRMRFAVLSFLTFSCCRDGRAFKSLSLSSC